MEKCKVCCLYTRPIALKTLSGWLIIYVGRLHIAPPLPPARGGTPWTDHRRTEGSVNLKRAIWDLDPSSEQSFGGSTAVEPLPACHRLRQNTTISSRCVHKLAGLAWPHASATLGNSGLMQRAEAPSVRGTQHRSGAPSGGCII